MLVFAEKANKSRMQFLIMRVVENKQEFILRLTLLRHGVSGYFCDMGSARWQLLYITSHDVKKGNVQFPSCCGR